MAEANKAIPALVAIRRQTGKTQADVAAEIGVSKSTYAAWEVGRNACNTDQILMLAEYFCCTPNDIVGWQGRRVESDSEVQYERLTFEERKFLELFDLLAPNNRASILDLMQSCTKRRRPKMRS